MLSRQLGNTRKGALAAAGYLVIVTAACLLAGLFSHDYAAQDLNATNQWPSLSHWLGTDLLGRDLLSRMLYGGRISLIVAAAATAVALCIGVPYGLVAGWFGGRVDYYMMRFVELVYSLPYLIFVILIMVFIGRGMWALLLAIGAVEWLTMARLVRGQVQWIRKSAFVEASEILGQSRLNIIQKHLLKNIMGVILVAITITVPGVILMESFLSFLGLGVQAPQTSWGDLIHVGVETLEVAPFQLIFPSLLFISVMYALNRVADELAAHFRGES